MKKLLFGTTNEAKIKQVRGALSPAGIEVNGVLDKSILPEVIEDGKTAIENARKKSLAYAKALNKKLIMVVKEGASSPRIRSVCDLYIEFEDIGDLESSLSDYLNSAFAVSQ